jgi:hypothetical protein
MLYEGAVRRKLTIDTQDDAQPDDSEGGEFQPGQSMSMSQALARTSGDSASALDSLNRDSNNAGLGDLFEYATA